MADVIARHYNVPSKIDNTGITAYEIWGDAALWSPREGFVVLLTFRVEGSDHVLCMVGPLSFLNFGIRNPYLYGLCLSVGKDWVIREKRGGCHA